MTPVFQSPVLGMHPGHMPWSRLHNANANGPYVVASVKEDRVWYVPVQVTHQTQFQRIGSYIQSSPGAHKITWGVYDTDESFCPGEILATGEITAGTTGLVQPIIDVTLSPGWYWLALVHDTAGLSFRCADPALVSNILSWKNPAVMTPTAYFQDMPYGPLPPTGGVTVTADQTDEAPPLIWLRAAP